MQEDDDEVTVETLSTATESMRTKGIPVRLIVVDLSLIP